MNYNNAMEMLVEKTLLKSIDDIKDVFSDKFFSFPDEFWKMTLSAIKSRNTVSGKISISAMAGRLTVCSRIRSR